MSKMQTRKSRKGNEKILMNKKLPHTKYENIENFKTLHQLTDTLEKYDFDGERFKENKRFVEEKAIPDSVQKASFNKSYNIKKGDEEYKSNDNYEERRNLANVLNLNKKANTFLDYDRFKYTFRDYLLDILDITDESIIKAIDQLVASMPSNSEDGNNFSNNKKNYRSLSDDLLVYYIYYLIDKLENVNDNMTPAQKAFTVVKFIYVILFHGIDSMKESDYNKIINNHDKLEEAFTEYFDKKPTPKITPGIPKENMQLTCKQFVDEYLCGNNSGLKYGKRTQMYRLLTGMQSCIYGDPNEIEVLMNNARKCENAKQQSDILRLYLMLLKTICGTGDKNNGSLCGLLSGVDCDKESVYDYIIKKRGCFDNYKMSPDTGEKLKKVHKQLIDTLEKKSKETKRNETKR